MGLLDLAEWSSAIKVAITAFEAPFGVPNGDAFRDM